MNITVEQVSMKDLLKHVQDAGVRRVLLTDYATVEPKRKGGAIVLVGMVRVVATAFDRSRRLIYRWTEEGESEQMVTVTAGLGRGRNPGGRLAARKEEVYQLLREEGLEVDEGEWTPESAQSYAASLKKFVG